MQPTDPLLLPDDVLIFPVASLDPTVRASIAAEEDEFGVTKRNSRRTTRVVDSAAAALLEEFRSPTSVPDAIRRFSASAGLNAGSILEQSFVFLTEMVKDGFLVPAPSSTDQDSRPLQAVDGWQVLETLRKLEDTGVYLVSSRAGARGVLKQIAPDADRWIWAALQNEARILKRLEGAGAPRLLEDRSTCSPSHIVVEWQRGLPARLAADQLRRPWLPSARRELASMCLAILDAYVALHERGVVHADVHPENVLVDLDTGTAALIDFGLAVSESDPAPSEGPRGGVQAFYPPEAAAAALARARPPRPTAAAEQYSVAALIYLLVTGHEYLEAVLDPDAWHQAVCKQAPMSFVRLGQPPWPELEAVLAQAMSKAPAGRYGSMAEFRDAVAEAVRTYEPQRRPTAAGAPGASWEAPGLFETVLARLTSPADVSTRRLPRPTAGLNQGATGISYVLYRAAQTLDRPDLLAAADLWIERAKREAAKAPRDAFYDDTRGADESKIGRASLYHSAVGLHCVEALIACSAGQQRRAQAAIDRLIGAAQVPEERADLATGYAGQLIACAALLEASRAAGYEEEHDRLVALGRRRGDELLSRWAPLGTRVPGANEAVFGIAHGWAGAVYAILRFAAGAGDTVPEQVDQTLRALGEIAHREDGQAWWPVGVHNPDVWTGWCHGSAGYTLLWTYAQRCCEQELLPLAKEAGEHMWAQDPPPAGHLCCGSAGQSYAFLALHRLTGEGAYVDRARQRLEHAVGSVGTRAMVADSLYKGDLGVALLEAELSQPFLAAMPLFEPENWP